MRILIIDDDPMFRALLADVAKKLGCNHYSFSTATAALHLLDKVDLILIDWHLPDMTGGEFVKLARQKDKQIPIIMVTVRQGFDCIAECSAAGANRTIRKPVDIAHLMDCIREEAQEAGISAQLKSA